MACVSKCVTRACWVHFLSYIYNNHQSLLMKTIHRLTLRSDVQVNFTDQLALSSVFKRYPFIYMSSILNWTIILPRWIMVLNAFHFTWAFDIAQTRDIYYQLKSRGFGKILWMRAFIHLGTLCEHKIVLQ